MDLCGSVHANLRAAVQSARRLKDGPVHPDTIDYWSKLVTAAKGQEVRGEYALAVVSLRTTQ